jgi:hypothetical protein
MRDQRSDIDVYEHVLRGVSVVGCYGAADRFRRRTDYADDLPRRTININISKR